MTYDTSNVNLRIAQAVTNCGKSVQEISKAMGVSASAFYNWMNGTTSPPIDRLPYLSKVLGVDPALLVFGTPLSKDPIFSSDLTTPDGVVKVSEVAYEESVSTSYTVKEWLLDAEFVAGLNVRDLNALILVQIKDSSFQWFKADDYAFVDTGYTDISRPGVYLFFRPHSPYLRYATLIKVSPKTITLRRGGGTTGKMIVEGAAADALIPLGRIVGSVTKTVAFDINRESEDD